MAGGGGGGAIPRGGGKPRLTRPSVLRPADRVCRLAAAAAVQGGDDGILVRLPGQARGMQGCCPRGGAHPFRKKLLTIAARYDTINRNIIKARPEKSTDAVRKPRKRGVCGSGKGRTPKEERRCLLLVPQIRSAGLSLLKKAERYMFMVYGEDPRRRGLSLILFAEALGGYGRLLSWKKQAPTPSAADRVGKRNYQ